jgi:threonyl-tRNA synthetase
MAFNKQLNELSSILLAKSVKDIYPDVIFGESLVDENGFSYSFVTNKIISIKDLPKILKQMHKNIDRNYALTYETIKKDVAQKIFANQKYKLELIDAMEQIPIVRFNNDFIDICSKTDFSTLSAIKAFKLFNVAGVY